MNTPSTRLRSRAAFCLLAAGLLALPLLAAPLRAEDGERPEARETQIQREAELLLDQGRRLANSGRQADSVAFYRRALDYLAVAHGAHSKELARREIELAHVLRDAGRGTAARALLEELVQRLQSRSGRGMDELLQKAKDDLQAMRTSAPSDPSAPSAPSDPSPRPSPSTPPAATKTAEPDRAVYRAQLMARTSRAEAEREAENLRAAYPRILRGLPSHLETVDLGERGVWHRVQFGAFSTPDAVQSLCDRLRRAGWRDCLVARP